MTRHPGGGRRGSARWGNWRSRLWLGSSVSVRWDGHVQPASCRRPAGVTPRGGWRRAVLVAAASCVALSGCADVVQGRAVSPIYDPATAGGLPINNVPSGPRANAPALTLTVHGTDMGPIDKLAALSVEDIEEYWRVNFPRTLSGKYEPVTDLYSYDSHNPASPTICDNDTYGLTNAFFCDSDWLIAWDRGAFLPVVQKYFGDAAVTGVLSHEYGHAIQSMAHLVKKSRTVLVAEQQADCFAGDYLRWVAEGKSPRFTLDTGDGLNKVLAGVITSRDPASVKANDSRGHGTALDRVAAFQAGFTSGATACAAITMESIQARRDNLPEALQPAASARRADRPITETSVRQLIDELAKILSPKTTPTLSMQPAQCAGTESTTPVSYCPASNTVFVDLPGLQKLGEPGDERHDYVLLQGTNTAISALISRYALAVQHERGLPMSSTATALRTACLTGIAERQLGQSGDAATSLTSRDIDQAVAGLLGNGLAASDADGTTVPAGFNRIAAFRAGLTTGSIERCYADFRA
ncbi:neutral zinc metallopeptidase (plasmid) [Mycobacterium avium subsp. hominissuis]|uniref:Peptidase n=2 Tax=Mycobacterium avium TaxID=1764 RepID=A0A2A3LDL3_MYCAV|nr:peptidase [Mycobacterium avium subsp. hominissuis]QWY65436.1 neutral zinc metallopeptidase [Mycobacterium avium subsp. hominissuis]